MQRRINVGSWLVETDEFIQSANYKHQNRSNKNIFDCNQKTFLFQFLCVDALFALCHQSLDNQYRVESEMMSKDEAETFQVEFNNELSFNFMANKQKVVVIIELFSTQMCQNFRSFVERNCRAEQLSQHRDHEKRVEWKVFVFLFWKVKKNIFWEFTCETFSTHKNFNLVWEEKWIRRWMTSRVLRVVLWRGWKTWKLEKLFIANELEWKLVFWAFFADVHDEGRWTISVAWTHVSTNQNNFHKSSTGEQQKVAK